MRAVAILFVLLFVGCSSAERREPRFDVLHRADVVIAGGSLAALTAAVTAAECGARVILLEPTDWIGGQITSSGVPAIDEAWHRLRDDDGNVLLDVARIARNPKNQPPALVSMLRATGNPGRGWVSRFCFEPRPFLETQLEPWAHRFPDRLTILRNSVVKSVETEGAQVVSLTAIERTPLSVEIAAYDRLLSEDLPDWYDPAPSARFDKRVHRFDLRGAVVIDATEWGEVLALSDAPYLQGHEHAIGIPAGADIAGQATVFGFVQEFHEEPTVDTTAREVPAPRFPLGFGLVRDREDAWSRIWTYRRLRGSARPPQPGDLSLQNWGFHLESGEGGNDHPDASLFLSRAETRASRDDWRGGVNLSTIAGAEARAFAWHAWFRDHAPPAIGSGRITLAADVLGTRHGLSRLPYVRDTRRSIGLDGFLLRHENLIGPPEQRTGTIFSDRVALGAYPIDVHPLVVVDYPSELEEQFENGPTLPFTLPLRALTNARYENLLVAGKTMAQTFLANAATRVHPVEWAGGTATGVISARMAKEGWTSRQAFEQVEELQRAIAPFTPVDWTLP